MVFLFVLITFDPILNNSLRFWTNLEIQDGRHSEMITQLLRHVTSPAHDAQVKGDIFRRTIYPPSLVVIAFIFSELQNGKEFLPGLRKTKKARSKYILKS